jgi:hypothetical protein
MMYIRHLIEFWSKKYFSFYLGACVDGVDPMQPPHVTYDLTKFCVKQEFHLGKHPTPYFLVAILKVEI